MFSTTAPVLPPVDPMGRLRGENKFLFHHMSPQWDAVLEISTSCKDPEILVCLEDEEALRALECRRRSLE
jgi:hypothetical protein